MRAIDFLTFLNNISRQLDEQGVVLKEIEISQEQAEILNVYFIKSKSMRSLSEREVLEQRQRLGIIDKIETSFGTVKVKTKIEGGKVEIPV